MANNTILLIDYEPRSIERFRDPLIAAGFSVELATDGISGIEAFHRLNPDMVLVEAMIPKKHGFEVCQELKRTPHGRQTPIIITTGVYKGRKYRTQALHIYGCDEYIEKPISAEQLLEIVGRFLSLGGSASSEKVAESVPRSSQASARPIVAEDVDAIAKTGLSAPRDDRDDDITDRIDALLSGGGAGSPVFTVANEVAAVAMVDQDFFAQMKAELDAELDSIETILPFENPPKLEPIIEALGSDQVVSPSVLEALPIPGAEPPSDLTPPAKSGQVVDFKAKRSRKNRKQEKPDEQHPLQVEEVAVAANLPIQATEITLPRGTIVESELQATVQRRRIPVWGWSAAAVVVVVSMYFLLSNGNSTPSKSESSTPPPTRTVASAPPVVAPPVAEVQPPVATPSSEVSAPSARSVPDSPKPVLVAAKIPAPKKRPVTVPLTTVAPAVILESSTTEPVSPEPLKPERSKSNAAVPPAPDTIVAGAGTTPDSAAAPAVTTIAPGALMPMDVADTVPVPLKRKAPTYSAEARELQLSGTVTMNVLVNDSGTVDAVVLVSGVPGADANEAAMAAAKTWTYRPATKNGVPVKVWRSEQVVVKP